MASGVLEALWSAGTSRAVNVRMFSEFKLEREALEKTVGRSLPDPLWWKRLSDEAERSASRPG